MKKIIKWAILYFGIISISFGQQGNEIDGLGKVQFSTLTLSNEKPEVRLEILSNYAKIKGIDFDDLLGNVYDTFVVRSDLYDMESQFYCKNAIQILGLGGYLAAAEFIKSNYIYNKEKLEKSASSMLGFAVEAYLNIEPSDLFDVLEYAIIDNGVPVGTRYRLAKLLIEFTSKPTYRNQTLSQSYVDFFTDIVITELQSSNHLEVVLDLDKMLCNINNNYKNSSQRLSKLISIKNDNLNPNREFEYKHILDSYNSRFNELKERISYLESIPESTKTTITIKSKSEWK